MKKIMSIMLVAVMLLSTLAGCSSTKSKDAPDDKTSKEVNVNEYGKIDWKQFEGTELSVITTAMAVTDSYEKYLKEFEELTGIKVKWEVLGDTDRLNAELVDFKAGSGKYDVVNVGISNREQFAAGGYLESLTPFLENEKLTDAKWYNIEDYPKDVLAGGTTKTGSLVTIPYTAEYFLLWYRSDIFEQLKLEVPKTLDELVETADKINLAREEGKVTTYAYADRTMPGSGESGWTMFCEANRVPVDLMDYENKMAFINTPEGISFMEHYTDMIRKYGPEGSNNWAWTEVNDAFNQGLVAMVCGGNAGAPGAADPENSVVADKVNFAPVPMNENGKDPLWEWGFGINAASKNKDAAWLLVQWLTSPVLTSKIAPEIGCPARSSVYEEDAYIKAMPSQEFVDAQKYMMEQGINPSPSLLDAAFSETSDIISREMNNVLAGSKDAKAACADAEKKLMEIGYTAAD